MAVYQYERSGVVGVGSDVSYTLVKYGHRNKKMDSGWKKCKVTHKGVLIYDKAEPDCSIGVMYGTLC